MKAYYRDIKKAAVDSATNKLMRDVVGNKSDAAATVLTATNSLMSYLKRLAGAEISIAKTDSDILSAGDPLFTITGGPIMVMEFVGVVTTVIGATVTTMQIQEAVTTPSGTVNLSTAVAITDDAAGTSYTFTAAAPGVLTPTTAGGLANAPAAKWLCPIGSINAKASANNTGAISWYMSYKPLSPLSKVVVAS